jgi:hypothetical protein
MPGPPGCLSSGRNSQSQKASMNLVVHLPADSTEESAYALSRARRAPSFTIERVKGRRIAVAIFPSLPVAIDLALELVGEAVRLHGAWASMNATPLSSLAKLWQRLACYRESLTVADPAQYCLKTTAGFHALVGCEGQRCPVPCQFMCVPCLGLTQEPVVIVPDKRYRTAAKVAEIDWCPHLMLPPAAPAPPVVHTPAD